MTTNALREYEIFDGSGRVSVDYAKKEVYVDEYGGWSRRYRMSFAELHKQAALWQMSFSETMPEAELADMGARLIWAEHALVNGLSADRYVNKPTTLAPDDKKIVAAFVRLMQVYGPDLVAQKLGPKACLQLQHARARLDDLKT